MTVGSEARLQTKQTRAFIAAKPVSIVFTKHTLTRNERSGVDDVARPIQAQTVRVDRAHLPYLIVGTMPTPVGRISRSHDRLLALPDADVAEGYTFSWEGQQWKVTAVRPTTYEIAAVIERL